MLEDVARMSNPARRSLFRFSDSLAPMSDLRSPSSAGRASEWGTQRGNAVAAVHEFLRRVMFSAGYRTWPCSPAKNMPAIL